MPFIDLVAKDDFASIWYRTNTLNLNVGGFDPEKPTIVMLHPLHVDASWLYPQLEDPRLTWNYNIITFDTRMTGKSFHRFSGRYDLWVAAADLAHAFYHLRLPPAHIFASEVFTYVALRLAALFPDLCLSLTLCNVSAQTEPKAVFDGYEELTRLWCFAEDLKSFEYACGLHLSYNASPDVHPELADEMVAYFQMNFPPFKRSSLITIAQVVLNRTPMTASELAAVRCPVLICQAQKNPIFPVIFAEKLVRDLVNVPDGAMLYNVKAATMGFITIFSASIVNKVFSTFLSRQPNARSDLEEPTRSLIDTMKAALLQLAKFEGDMSIAKRDPRSPLSFSRTTDEVRKSQEDTYKAFEKDQRYAFSPLSPNGRPIRKYSERQDDWMMQIGSDGFSYSSQSKASAKESKKFSKKETKHKDKDKDKNKDRRQREDIVDKNLFDTPDPPRPPTTVPLEEVDIPISDPVSSSEQAKARSRRMMVGPSFTVEQQVVKGPMTKATSHSTGVRKYL